MAFSQHMATGDIFSQIISNYDQIPKEKPLSSGSNSKTEMLLQPLLEVFLLSHFFLGNNPKHMDELQN